MLKCSGNLGFNSTMQSACWTIVAIATLLLAPPVFAADTTTTHIENDSGGFGDRVQLQEDAERGDSLAQARLGFSYHKLSPFDEIQAVFWWRKAAANGMPMSQCALGNAYRDGQGIAKDESLAIVWWRKAAMQGEIEAQANLADAYRKDLYTPSGSAEQQMLRNELQREEIVSKNDQRRGWNAPFLDEHGDLKMVR